MFFRLLTLLASIALLSAPLSAEELGSVLTPASTDSGKMIITPPAATTPKKAIVITTGLMDNSLAVSGEVSTTLAVVEGADYIVLPVIMSKDNVLLVAPSTNLNNSNVGQIFPGRQDKDGNYFSTEFTLAELLLIENISPQKGYFIGGTLDRHLEIVRTLAARLAKSPGIILELKQAWRHRDRGLDLSKSLLAYLDKYDFAAQKETFFLQSYDPDELERIHQELLPQYTFQLPLIQLIGLNDGAESQQKEFGSWQPYNYDWLFTNLGLRFISNFASGIAIDSTRITGVHGELLLKEYIATTHKYGLKVFALKVSTRNNEVPEVVNHYLAKGILDGIYTNSIQPTINYSVQVPDQETVVKDKQEAPSISAKLSQLNISKPASEIQP